MNRFTIFLIVSLQGVISMALRVHQRPCQKFDNRLIGPPELILIHQFETTALTERDDVSVHYFIHKNGSVDQLVAETKRAWHAGKSFWHGRYLLDDWSIAIGLERDEKAMSPEATSSLISLIRDIRSRNSRILNTGIVCSYDTAVERGNSSIPLIPWFEMARAGIGICPLDENETSAEIPSDEEARIADARVFLKEIGYYVSSQTSTTIDSAFKATLNAFQARFVDNDGVTGNVDSHTYAVLLRVRIMYIKEYEKRWHQRPMLASGSSLVVNTSFQSSNFNQRLLGPPFMIVIHDTEINLEDSLRVLTDPNNRPSVSAHYLIDRSGSIYRLVDEMDRAWHAGVSYWKGRKDLNDVSIGIELVNVDSTKYGYPDEQMRALMDLLTDIRQRFNIPTHFIVSHEDIAPTRRADPGLHFPWHKLVRAGQSIGPMNLSTETLPSVSYEEYIANIRCMLKQIGYLMEPQTSAAVDDVLRASVRRFQWRFAPAHPNWTLSEVDATLYSYLVAVRNAYIQSYQEHAVSPVC